MATRLYLETGPVPAQSPAFDAAWGQTTSADRSVTQTVKRGSTLASKATSNESSTSVLNLLNRQFVSPPLSGAQTITGTVKGQIKSNENNAAADARAQIVIRVVSGDGTTVRGTLVAADSGALSSEFGTSSANRKFPLAAISPVTVTSVAAQDGDRIVIEVGGRMHNTVATLYNVQQQFGSSVATDLPEDETTTLANNAWIELSQTLTFVTQASVGGVSAQALVKTVGKGRVGGLSAQVLVGGSTGQRTLRAEIAADAPLVWYRLDEGDGLVAQDRGSLAQDGTLHSYLAVQGCTGIIPTDQDGSSLATGYGTTTATDPFSGAGNASLNTTSWTAEVWVKTKDATSDVTIASRRAATAGARQWELWLNGTTAGKISGSGFDVAGARVGTIESTSTVNDGLVHHIALVFDLPTTTLSLYVDGVLEASTSSTTGLNNSASTAGLRLGHRTSSSGAVTEAKYQEFAVYGAALSAARIAAHNTAGRQGALPVSAGGYEALLLTDGATGLYKLDETTGTTFDNAEGTAARDGTSWGTPTLGASSLVPNAPSGKAITLSGSNGVDMPSLADWNQTAFTIEATIKTSSVVATDHFIAGKDGGGTTNRQWQFKLTSAGLLQFIALNSSTAQSTVTGERALNDGVAHHVLVTYTDSGVARMWVDGRVESSDSSAGPIATGVTGWTIGARAPNSHTLTFIGDIDDVAYYPKALTPKQAEAHYEAWAVVSAAASTFDGWGIAV